MFKMKCLSTAIARTTMAVSPVLLATVIASPANAQLEEVVVTAQKRESSLQDTPIAITAFTADSLESIGAFNATDLGEYAPNVTIVPTFGSAGNIRTSIRGVSTGEPSLTIDPKVGMYVDGAYIARNAGAVFDIVDIERVEILRGPQGTLWGKNTTGGAINIITQKPKGELGFKQSLTFGDDGEFRSLSSFDTPTMGGVSAKFSYMKKDYDGWATNTNPLGEKDLGSEDTSAYRVALRWEPSESFFADYTYEYSDIDAVPIPLQITHLGPGATDPSILGSFNLQTGEFTPGYNPLEKMLSVVEPNKRVEKFDLDGNSVESTNVYGHNLTMVWDTDLLQIKSITAYRDYESKLPGNDLDGGAWTTDAGVALPMFQTAGNKDQNQFSQELQFIGSAWDDRVDYVAGLFYFQEDGTEINPWNAMFYNPGTPVILGGVGASAGAWYSMDNKSKAAYGQLKYYVNEQWDVTLGLRYTDDEKEVTLLAADPRIDESHSTDDEWSEVTSDFIVTYTMNDDVSFYGKRAEGYNAGVFSIGALNHDDYNDFSVFDVPADPEEIVSWELGMKSEWLDQKLRLNVAAFYNDNQNLQITEFVNGVRTVRNSGENTTEGFEMDFSALLPANFRLDGAYGYRKTDFDDTNGRADGKHSGSVSLVYGLPLDWAYLDARFDTTYTDAENFSSSLYGNSEARTLMNARVGLSEISLGKAGSMRFAVWGRNLTDEEYKVYGADLGVEQGLGYAGNSFGAPRRFGIDFIYEY
jgi:iron complex outermembrane receptor protein